MNRQNLLRMNIAGESSVGLVRRHNEDSFFIVNDPEFPVSIAVAADGLGGHKAGDFASQFLCYHLRTEFLRLNRRSTDAEYYRKYLVAAIKDANYQLYKISWERGLNPPMGSTAAAAVFLPDEVVIAWVGDSRVYGFSKQRRAILQLTVDHNWQEFLRSHPERLSQMPQGAAPGDHVLMRAVGIESDVEVDTKVISRTADLSFLLCTDGLTHGVPDSTLESAFLEMNTPRRVAGRLMRQALLAGGKDNVTIVAALPAAQLPE